MNGNDAESIESRGALAAVFAPLVRPATPQQRSKRHRAVRTTCRVWPLQGLNGSTAEGRRSVADHDVGARPTLAPRSPVAVLDRLMTAYADVSTRRRTKIASGNLQGDP
jgi:hypothetical protein